MGESVGTRQLNFQIGARVGNVIVSPVTNVASQVTIPVWPTAQPFIDRYVTLQNDSATTTLYYLLGAPGSTPVPNPATTGGPGSATACPMLAPNASIRIRLQREVDGVIGFVTSAGTTTARLYCSSNQQGYDLGNPPGQG